MTGPLDALRTVDARAAAAVVRPEGVLDSVGDPEESFDLASVTKLISAYALLIAVEEGVVGLEDPVGPPGATLAHLLAHASGLGSEQSDGVRAPPGTRRIYSNAGFELAAAHVSARTGIAFSHYVEAGICEPLQLRHTMVVGSPAYGASSTSGDLSLFVRELLAPRLISPATLRRATSVAFGPIPGVLPGYGMMDPLDWGLGFELRDRKDPHWTGRRNSAATFGHFGRSGTFVWVDPQVRLGLVVLVDKAFGTWATRLWPAISDGVLTAFEASEPGPVRFGE